MFQNGIKFQLIKFCSLHLEDVVECYAQIGDWLQIRFEEEDNVWVRFQMDRVVSEETVDEKKKEGKDAKGNKFAGKGGGKIDNQFGDDYFAYEIDGKKFKVLQQPGERITPERVAVFDQIRFKGPPEPLSLGGLETDSLGLIKEPREQAANANKQLLLHRLPNGLQRLLLQQAGRPSPLAMDQKKLFQLVIDNDDVSYDLDLAVYADSSEGLEMLEKLEESSDVFEQSVSAEDSQQFHFPST